MPSRPSSVGGYVPIFPRILPPLVWPPMASRRHFYARGQQGRGEAKTQNRRKGRLQARGAVLMSVSISILPHRKTAHRSRQRPAQGINQPRPAPSGVSRGFVICSGPGIAPRIVPPFGHTRRSIYHGISPLPLHRSALYRGRVVSTGRTASKGIVACL